MANDPRVRASDSDRDRVATLLREHHAAGRLNAEEFHERLDAAFAAKTLGDLDALLADLPAIDLYRLPAAGIKPAPPGARRPRSHHRRGPGSGLVPGQDGLDRTSGRWLFIRETGAWVNWAVASALLLAVWALVALTNGGLAWFPWFLIVSLPWTIHLFRRGGH
jgi:hypothetical protein